MFLGFFILKFIKSEKNIAAIVGRSKVGYFISNTIFKIA